MDSISNEVVQLNSEIEKIIYHSFVLKYIDQPNINDDMIAVMVKILHDAKVDQRIMPYYIISVMLMQIALDTHENVSNTEEGETPIQLRQRQLSILAGDYYSSMYYHILAKTKDIEFINRISKGVQEVNEAKVSLYMDKDTDPNIIIKHLCRIETLLVDKTAEYFNVTEQKDLIINFLLLKRLYAELEAFRNNTKSNFIQVLQSIHTVFDNQEDKISYLLNQAIKDVSEKLKLSIINLDSRDELVIRIKESIKESQDIK